jgi:ADP-ribose pyrophosphatase YjhB (NUDIX family)
MASRNIYKKSYGIICCRFNEKNETEVLMVKKKCTYAFLNFLLGKYKMSDKKGLKHLFNSMTQKEKYSILEYDFDKLWSLALNRVPQYDIKSENYNLYSDKYTKFYKTFNKKNKLFMMLNQSKSAGDIWDYPKGRSKINEKPLNTAIREFCEETGASLNDFQLMLHLKPIQQNYKYNNYYYTITYFIAVAKQHWKPRIHFSSYEQMLEVDDICWVQQNTLNILNNNQSGKKRTQSIYKITSKLIKPYKLIQSS